MVAVLIDTCRCRQSFTVSLTVGSVQCTVGQLDFILLPQTGTHCSAIGIVWQHNTADLTQADTALNTFAALLPGRKPAASLPPLLGVVILMHTAVVVVVGMLRVCGNCSVSTLGRDCPACGSDFGARRWKFHRRLGAVFQAAPDGGAKLRRLS